MRWEPRQRCGCRFDLYHRQVTEGDLVHGLRDNADITAHIQVANPPDRADPGFGEIDYGHRFPGDRGDRL